MNFVGEFLGGLFGSFLGLLLGLETLLLSLSILSLCFDPGRLLFRFLDILSRHPTSRREWPNGPCCDTRSQ